MWLPGNQATRRKAVFTFIFVLAMGLLSRGIMITHAAPLRCDQLGLKQIAAKRLPLQLTVTRDLAIAENQNDLFTSDATCALLLKPGTGSRVVPAKTTLKATGSYTYFAPNTKGKSAVLQHTDGIQFQVRGSQHVSSVVCGAVAPYQLNDAELAEVRSGKKELPPQFTKAQLQLDGKRPTAALRELGIEFQLLTEACKVTTPERRTLQALSRSHRGVERAAASETR